MFGQNTYPLSGSPPPYNTYRLSNTTSESRSSSPASRSIPSGRKGSKKVRTGCVTCKVRKVKCDETKPFCSRCTKTGRKCDGYLDPKTLSKRRSLRDVAPHDHVLEALLEIAAPEEKRAFWFFQHCTAPCISGVFDADFWKVMVLQVCQTEPAVRHAVLAISSLHEALGGTMSLIDSSLARPQQDFAQQQYNKAISCLVVQMNDPSTRPVAKLLTYVLFVCIEYMRGQDKQALIHLESGRQLLAQLDRRSHDPEIQFTIQNIVRLYTRLSLTSFLFGGSPGPVPDARKYQRDIPDAFDSFDNMRFSMQGFMEQAFRFTQRARPAKNADDAMPDEMMHSLQDEQGHLLARLARLSVAFSLFRASRSNPGPEKTLLVLQMYLYAQHIWISTALSSSEVVYDNFLSSFAAIVPLAASYLDLEPSSQHRGVSPPQSSQHSAVPEEPSVAYTTNFTFETHVIPPLYYVAIKCRHPLIRQSALDLLRRKPSRRQNLWRASVMGALAGHIVSVEERWSQARDPCQVIPRHAYSHDTIGLYSNSMEVNQLLVAPELSAPVPTLNFDATGPHFFPMNADVSSSLSQPTSLTTSSSSSMMEPTMTFFSPPMHSDTWNWQQQQQHHFQHHDAGPINQMDYAASTLYDTIQGQSHQEFMGHDNADHSSNSGSSELSSIDLEEQGRLYQDMVRSYSPPHQYRSPPPRPQQTPQQQQAYQQPSKSMPQASLLGTAPPRQRSPTPSNLVMEAPFGLPEEMRVHDAIIGPEWEDGTWVAVFRKLHGVDADWDVQDDWAPTR